MNEDTGSSLQFNENLESLTSDNSLKQVNGSLEQITQDQSVTLQNALIINKTNLTNGLLELNADENGIKNYTSQPLTYNLIAAQNSIYDITSLINTISSESKGSSGIILCSPPQGEKSNKDIPCTSSALLPETNSLCDDGKPSTSNKNQPDSWNDLLQITVNGNGEIEVTNIGSVPGENLDVGSNEETTTLLENDSHLRYINKESQTSGNQYKCMVYNCYKNLNSYKEMIEHRKTHQKEKVYRCTYENCPWSFMTQYKLNRHLQSHKREKKFPCPYAKCNRVFSTSYNMKVHAKAHAEKKEECKCKFCGKQFVDKRNLGNHMRKEHDVEPTFSCTFTGCNKKLHTLAALKLHMKMHLNGGPKSVECPFEGCGKKFSKNAHLKEHIYTHTGERPFKCDDCDWTFTSSGLLKRHKQIHSAHKKFICPVDNCKREFSRSLRFKKHLKDHDIEGTATGVLIQTTLSAMDREHLFYICPYEECGSLFKSLKGAKQHMRQLHDTLKDGNKSEHSKDKTQDDASDNEKMILVGNASALMKSVENSQDLSSDAFITTTVSENDVENPQDCIEMDQIFLNTSVDLSAVDLSYSNVDPADFFNGISSSTSDVVPPCSMSHSLKVSNLDCGASTSSADVYFNLNECSSSVDPNVVMSINKAGSSSDTTNSNLFEKCARTDITFSKYVEKETSHSSGGSTAKESTINLSDIT